MLTVATTAAPDRPGPCLRIGPPDPGAYCLVAEDGSLPARPTYAASALRTGVPECWLRLTAVTPDTVAAAAILTARQGADTRYYTESAVAPRVLALVADPASAMPTELLELFPTDAHDLADLIHTVLEWLFTGKVPTTARLGLSLPAAA